MLRIFEILQDMLTEIHIIAGIRIHGFISRINIRNLRICSL